MRRTKPRDLVNSGPKNVLSEGKSRKTLSYKEKAGILAQVGKVEYLYLVCSFFSYPAAQICCQNIMVILNNPFFKLLKSILQALMIQVN